MDKQRRKGTIMKKNLDVSDIYAIYYMVDNNYDIKTISKELGIGTKLIKDTINNRPKQKNESIPTTSSKITSKDMMIRETSAKRNRSVAIMTKEASEINDTFKKNLDSHLSSRTTKNAIYRPNNK